VLAAVRPGDRLHTPRPTPSGLQREASDGRAAQVHDINLRLVGSPTLVRRAEVTLLNASHPNLLHRSTDHYGTPPANAPSRTLFSGDCPLRFFSRVTEKRRLVVPHVEVTSDLPRKLPHEP